MQKTSFCKVFIRQRKLISRGHSYEYPLLCFALCAFAICMNCFRFDDLSSWKSSIPSRCGSFFLFSLCLACVAQDFAQDFPFVICQLLTTFREAFSFLRNSCAFSLLSLYAPSPPHGFRLDFIVCALIRIYGFCIWTRALRGLQRGKAAEIVATALCRNGNNVYKIRKTILRRFTQRK